MTPPLTNLALFRSPGQVRGFIGRLLYRGADRSLARLFVDVPVPRGNPADAFVLRCLAWTWRYIEARPREPDESRPTVWIVLADMHTYCEGFSVLLAAMLRAGLDPADLPRMRQCIGKIDGLRQHEWCQWEDVAGKVWMLDPAESETPIPGTGGWTVLQERGECLMSVNEV